MAILLPVLTRADVLEEALSDAGIPFVMEGGKFYYARSEVSSAITVLKAIANPNDAVALYGSLRSVFFGVSDEDLLRAKTQGLALDYRCVPPDGSPLARPYAILRELHRLRHVRGASETFQLLLEQTGAREVLAARGLQPLANLAKLNEDAGKPAKTVVLVHEDGLFGSGLAKLMQAELPKLGFEILDTIAHPTPTRDMSNVALQIRSKNPDLVIPSSYYGEFALLARTMQQQRIRPKGIYAVLNGAASNYRFVKEFNDAAQFVMDCNHWHDPRKPVAEALRQQVEASGKFWTYNIPLNYSCVGLLADAIERAGSADKAKVIEALAASTYAGHIMPYGPTKFTNGQNEGGAPVNTQVQGNDIKVIFPSDFADAKPVFPRPA